MSINKRERENLEKIRYCKRIEALSKRIREKAKERNIDLSKIPIVLK